MIPRDTEAMKSLTRIHHCPNAQYNNLRFRINVDNPSSCGPSNKTTTLDIDEAKQRAMFDKDWSTSRVMDTELIPKQGWTPIRCPLKKEVAHFTDGIYLCIRGLFLFRTFRSRTRRSPLPL